MAAAAGTRQAAAATPLHSAASFVDSVGINTHFSQRGTNYFKNTDRILSELRELKIRHLRDNAVFLGGTTRDHYAYTSYRRCAVLGHRFSLVCFDPTFPFGFTPPSELPRIFDWCNGAVAIFEGGNEPTIYKYPARDALVSAAHQRELYAVVRANRSSMPSVIVAAPSYILQNIKVAEPLSDACDVGNIHSYAGMDNPETTNIGSLPGYIAAVERISGKKPVIASEIGYHTALQTTSTFMPVPEQARARYMPRTLLWAFLKGVKRSYIYELASSSDNGPADKESHFGLLDSNMVRTPTFEAVRSLMTLCTDGGTTPTTTAAAALDITFSAPAGLSVALSRADGSVLLFAWHGIPAFTRRGEPVAPAGSFAATLLGTSQARSITAHRFGDDGRLNSTAVQARGASIPVTVSDQLTAFEIRL